MHQIEDVNSEIESKNKQPEAFMNLGSKINKRGTFMRV
jgi:hypothetical protein